MRTVPTLRDNVVLNVRILCTTQRFVQRPARGHGTHHVIPALHDGDGKVRDTMGISYQLPVGIEPAVDKVVALNAREGEGP